jgi:hypothetical protein
VSEAGRDRGEWWEDQQRAVTHLAQLESRRSAAELAQWQAPTLTIAAQAFLLTVLTDDRVSERALKWILIAGIAACVAAILSLVRLRSREVEYSEAIASACEKAGVPDPRPNGLGRKERPARYPWPIEGFVDRPVRWLGARLPVTVYLVWILALSLFIVADVIAYRSST